MPGVPTRTSDIQQSMAPFEGEAMDDFNSDKSLMRLTTDRVPNSNQLAKELGIPIAIVVKPYGELPSGDPV